MRLDIFIVVGNSLPKENPPKETPKTNELGIRAEKCELWESSENMDHPKGNHWLVVEPTHLKNMLVKMGSSSPNRDESKKCLKPPPSYSLFGLGILGKTSSEKGPENPLKKVPKQRNVKKWVEVQKSTVSKKSNVQKKTSMPYLKNKRARNTDGSYSLNKKDFLRRQSLLLVVETLQNRCD